MVGHYYFTGYNNLPHAKTHALQQANVLGKFCYTDQLYRWGKYFGVCHYGGCAFQGRKYSEEGHEHYLAAVFLARKKSAVRLFRNDHA